MSLYRSGSGIWRIGQSGLATAPAAGGASDWWLAGGIDPADCVAAYQAIGADSLAASYVNLANPGTYDAAPGVAPTWAAEMGWTFNGATQYLDTGVAPVNDKTWSAIVRYSDQSGAGWRAFMGSLTTGGMQWGISTNTKNEYYNGGAVNTGAPKAALAILAMSGTQGYANGVADGPTIGTGGGAGANGAIYIGALNNNGTAQYYQGMACQAFAIYNKSLSAAEVTALTIAMATLVEDDPAVYVTFDDAEESIYTRAYPYLAAAGIQATVYMTTDWIGTPGYLSAAQLQALDAAGWAIANHTKTHTDLTTLNLAQQEAELSQAKSALDALGLTKASADVGYPFGRNNADTLTAMANQSMRTGRTVTNGGVAEPVVAEYQIPAYEYYTGDSLDTLKANIVSNLCRGKSVMLYMHDVVEAAPETWELLYSEFTPLVDWLAANNIPCKTIDQMRIA